MAHRVRVSVRVSVVYAKVYNFSWPYLAARSARHYIVIEYRLGVMCRTWVSVPSLIRHGLDWPLNASSALSASAELLVKVSVVVAGITISGKLFHTLTILGAKENFLKSKWYLLFTNFRLWPLVILSCCFSKYKFTPLSYLLACVRSTSVLHQGSRRHKTELPGAHSWERLRHRQAPNDDDDDNCICIDICWVWVTAYNEILFVITRYVSTVNVIDWKTE